VLKSLAADEADVDGVTAEVASPIQSYLDGLHRRYASLADGEVASYIPELSKADPAWFGICVATTDGRLYEVGDTRQPFTIQSISKPFVYGLALEDRGMERVLAKIGVEPTGDAFNSISLASDTGHPLNPMINAGAITASSLVAGHSQEDRWSRILGLLSMYAGRALSLDHAVYESEKTTGHRNRAIGHMLRNFDIIEGDPDPDLDLYFRQCSVAIDCRDLSVMAACLANCGINPLTGDRVVPEPFVENILSVMTTCGMYDYAGEWVYWVGMPAKSGVGGGVLAVLPGQLGIGVFSPPLDARGNSVRGVRVCRDLSRDFNLHFLRVPRSSRSVLRARYSVASVRSKRMRNELESAVLDASGNRTHVYELAGDLVFGAVEKLVRTLVDNSSEFDYAILDLRRVTLITGTSAGILLELLRRLENGGKRILFAGTQDHARFVRFIEENLVVEGGDTKILRFPDLDAAIEWCENQIIDRRLRIDYMSPLPLGDHEICHGMDEDALAVLESVLETQSFAAGEVIIRRGDPADRIYLLTKGRVSITVDLPNGQLKRLSTMSPGMVFGELAIVHGGVRSADVRADEATECYTLSIEAFEELGKQYPRIKMTVLQNLLRNAARTVARLTAEVSILGT